MGKIKISDVIADADAVKKLKRIKGKNDYVEKNEDNLIRQFENWGDIERELNQGSGLELLSKFQAIHSSSCLCVNNFADFKKHKDKLKIFGFGPFTEAVFEKKLETGISRPNIDFYLENDEVVIAFESKYSEYFEKKEIKLDSYIKRKDELDINSKYKESILKICEFYHEKKSINLDVSQLIKHSMGLLNLKKEKPNKEIILVYIYWDSVKEFDDIVKQHEKDIKEFEQKLKENGLLGVIKFEVIRYEEYWEIFKENEFLKDSIKLNIERYKLN